MGSSKVLAPDVGPTDLSHQPGDPTPDFKALITQQLKEHKA